MRFACVLVVLLGSNVARAEDRSAVVSVGGAYGFITNETPMAEEAVLPEGVGAVRATLAWERPLPALPELGKSTFSGSLVPELVAGSLLEEDRAEGFLGLGLRAELRAAHNKIGLWAFPYKVGGYLVARALVLGKSQDAAYEFGFGEYFMRPHGSTTRVGFELTLISRPAYMETDQTQTAGLFSLFAGWSP